MGSPLRGIMKSEATLKMRPIMGQWAAFILFHSFIHLSLLRGIMKSEATLKMRPIMGLLYLLLIGHVSNYCFTDNNIPAVCICAR